MNATTLQLVWAVRRLAADAAGERLGPAAKSVLYALAAFQEREGDRFVIAPSIDQLAEGAGVSRSTALRVVADLEARKLIVRQRRSRRESFEYDLSAVVRLASRERSQADTSQRSPDDTSQSSHDDTSQRSHDATSKAERCHPATSRPDSRVVSNGAPSGVTVTPSEDLCLKTSPEDRESARAREVNSTVPDESESGGHRAPPSCARPESEVTRRSAPRVTQAQPPVQRGLTPPPATIELTQALKDECVMNGWPEPTEAHVKAFLLNAQSKGQLFADWIARFKWWMAEEKKRMGRRPLDAPPTPIRHEGPRRRELTLAAATADPLSQLPEQVRRRVIPPGQTKPLGASATSESDVPAKVGAR